MYRSSAVQCQVIRYSQRVPGYLTRYSVPANEISHDRKVSQSDCVFQLILSHEENYSPSPLGVFNRLFEGQFWVLFKLWHWNVSTCSVTIKKSGFHTVSCQLAPSNIRTHSTVLTNSSVLVACVVYGEWWQPRENLLNSVSIPYMSASVIECRSIGSYSSTGLCAGLMITGRHFQLLLTASLWHRMPVRGMKTIFKNLCYNIN